ncbi:ABC transporter substrate-binding protein [Amycolatopsis sp. PS_44_ISF1]|uniref:ABC transporter substrate-binding protein n=1 Tax=Amycolatopsis sp. PS_44_ISF1 TaxID=2974917 RepID=UPI0028DE0B50|nr:ABC transporter substrate-binding protein [Amycolatopsis sp. PS_44_ISF1]MDT8913635.1 ABC transporter substrate-binding protein [Amycolatopsis sp. PS_44_ISF1]
MKHIHHRPARCLAAGLTACLTLTACSSSGSSGADELTYWSLWRAEEPQAQVIKAAVDKFSAATGVKVHLEFQGRDVRTKIGAALAANRGPDLWDQGSDVIYSATVLTGQAADLSDVYATAIPGEGAKVGDVVPAKYLDVLPKDPDGGNRWMVPYEVVSAQMFYNGADPDFAKPPRTWDEFMSFCATLKAKDKPCLASDGDLGWENFLLLDYLLVRDHGPGTLARLYQDKTAAAWADPGIRATVERVGQLTRGGYLSAGYDASKAPTQQTKWAQGGGGFLVNGSWVPSEVAKLTAPGGKPAAPAVPVTGGGNDQADVTLFGWSVPKKAKNPAAAKKFIAYFMNKTVLGGIATTGGNITPRTDIPAPAALADVQKILTASPSRPVLDNLPGDYGDKVLFPAYLDLWRGKTDASGFVAAVREAQAAYWKSQS